MNRRLSNLSMQTDNAAQSLRRVLTSRHRSPTLRAQGSTPRTKPSRPENIRRLVNFDASSRGTEKSRLRASTMINFRHISLGLNFGPNTGVSCRGCRAFAGLPAAQSLAGVERAVAVSPVILMASIRGRLFKWFSAGPDFIRLAVFRAERLPPPVTRSGPPGLPCMRLARCPSGREPGHCAARTGNSRRQAEMVAPRSRREHRTVYRSPTSGRTVGHRSPSCPIL